MREGWAAANERVNNILDFWAVAEANGKNGDTHIEWLVWLAGLVQIMAFSSSFIS